MFRNVNVKRGGYINVSISIELFKRNIDNNV